MLKEYVRKIMYGHKSSSDKFITYLKKIGIDIGKDVTIYDPRNTIIDEQYPWMITIGNHVRITSGVKILTHDYSWSVLKLLEVNNLKGSVLGASGKIKIGNNVFIGMNTIILRNVTIGDNVVIGAGSVVTTDCQSNWVYAGNPAKKITSIEEFYNKRQLKQLEEAKSLALSYKDRYGRTPSEEIFHEYFMLFSSEENANRKFKEKMKLCENYYDSIEFVKNHEKPFQNYDMFLKYCFINEEIEVNSNE